MKLLIKSNYKKFCLIAASALSLLIISAMSWRFFNFHTVPSCKAVVKVIRHIDGERKESVMHINLVPSGFRTATFVVNGNATDARNSYTLSRIIEADYKYQSGYYSFSVKEVKKQPTESFSQDDMNKMIPMINTQYFLLKIEQLSNGDFVFTSNRAPAFVCSKTKK